MVILDEPNSNLDTAGDMALARALAHAKSHDMTVVVVTQKPSLLGSVDKIMLMADGNIAMFGQRQQVLAQLEQRRRPTPQNNQNLQNPNLNGPAPA